MEKLRKVPTILLAAFALELAFGLVALVMHLSGPAMPDWEGVGKWQLANQGSWLMGSILLAVGYRDLSDRVWGKAQRAARIASGFAIAMVALELVWMAVFAFDLGPRAEWFYLAENYVFWVATMGIVISLFVAGMQRDRALATAGLVIALVVKLPPHVAHALYKGLDLGWRGQQALGVALSLIYLLGVALMVVAAQAGEAAKRDQVASQGFTGTASGLTLRVIAAVVGMVLTLMAFGMGQEPAFKIVKFVLISGVLVNLISFAMVGVGTINVARSSVDGIAPYAALASGAASLWCAGVLLQQLPNYYHVLYGDSGGSRGQATMEALSVAMPIVAALAGAVLATVIAGLARTRGDEDLAARASGAGVGYVLLMLASIGIQTYLLKEAKSQGSAIGMMIAAAGCALAAQVILAKVCRGAALVVSAAPELPTARLNEPAA